MRLGVPNSLRIYDIFFSNLSRKSISCSSDKSTDMLISFRTHDDFEN